MTKTLVLSKPGSGKTTYLAQKIKEAISQKKTILATSFGRKNVEDLRMKMLAHGTGILKNEIRTLHSFCFRHSQFEHNMNLTRELFKNGHEQGFYFGSTRLKLITGLGYDELDFRGVEPETDHDKIYDELMRLRNRLLKPADTLLSGWQAEELNRLWEHITSKFDQGYWDFTYLLEYALETGFQLQADFIGVDEVQDSSRLQIELLRKADAGEIYYLGDPDQSIYSWAGGDPKDLALLEVDRIEDRPISWRVPNSIAEYADRVLKQATYRSPGTIVGNGQMGSVSTIPSFERVCWKLSQDKYAWGEVFILARTNHLAYQARKIAETFGLNLVNDEEDEVRQELIKLILHPTPTVSHYQFGLLLHPILDAKVYYRRGAKARMRSSFRDEPNEFMDWEKFFRFFASSELIRVFRQKDVSFLLQPALKVRKRFNPLNPRVMCHTMHGSKGLEADTVVLIADTSSRILENENADEETRLAYVAATRAKQRLIISSLGGIRMRQVLFT